MALSELQAFLRKVEERTIKSFWNAIRTLVDGLKPDECINAFKTAGCKAD